MGIHDDLECVSFFVTPLSAFLEAIIWGDYILPALANPLSSSGKLSDCTGIVWSWKYWQYQWSADCPLHLRLRIGEMMHEDGPKWRHNAATNGLKLLALMSRRQELFILVFQF